MSFHIVPVAEADVMSLIKSIDRVIINPIIFFLFAVAMVYFLYGVAQYLLSPDNEEVHKKSKSHMIWGVVGLFIMVAVFGIMRIILNTLGENKIQINNNGDFNVTSTTLPDREVKDNILSGQDFFKPGSVDVSTNTDSPDLPANLYITSPFPTYEAKPTVCWNNKNQPFYSKSNTEYNALVLVKAKARDAYVRDLGIQAKDIKKDKLGNDAYVYPIMFESKVLYDKNAKIYHAWLDARAPIGTGKDADCNLKILAPARAVPESIVFSQSDVSNIIGAVDLPPEMYTTSPFATYEAKPTVCWNNGNKPLVGNGSTEFNALELVRKSARSRYLSDNKISPTDQSKAKYPTIFESKVLYNSKEKIYYAWLDVRAPIGTGKDADCILDVVAPARNIPNSIITSGELNLSESTINNYIVDFTKSPFTAKYQPNNLCWREEISANAGTEYQAQQIIKSKARSVYLKYLKDNNLVEVSSPKGLPITYGSFTAYDKATKNYYVWWDSRAPIKTGKESDCNLIMISPPVALGQPATRSAKPNPLATYASDNQYYRVVDSGSDADYYVARSIAINNALIQIAQLKGLNSVTGIVYKTILEEKYYPVDPYTLNYDYWVAIQSPK